MAANDEPPAGQLRRYEDKTTAQKSAFWLHSDRWTRAIALEILAPLRAAVDRDGVIESEEWSVYLRTVYDAACQATYEFRIKAGPNGEESLNDVQKVYAAVRAVPDEIFPTRSAVSEVPMSDGGPWDVGRREGFMLGLEGLQAQERRVR